MRLSCVFSWLVVGNIPVSDNYCADPWLLENMRKKAALERIQLENPGFDMSSAEVTGDYATGGPDIPC